MRKFLLFILMGICLKTYTQSYLSVIYISSESLLCENKQACLQSRENPTSEWRVFPYTIEGFIYEKGYSYCLLVEITKDSATTILNNKYRLIEIRSKEKAAQKTTAQYSNKYIPTDVKWFLYKLKTKDGIRTFSINKAFLLFNSVQQVSGNTGCNTMFSSYSIDSTSIKFENIASTKMFCGKNNIENEFINALSQTTYYKVTKKLLYLYKGKYLLALFIKDK